jgi:pimeloyl-ACP methyl ester carboxylesterase
MKVDQAAVDAVIEAHRSAGTFFEAAGVRSFVRAEGDGEPVVLMHGLPASSFLYRKVIPELATHGFRALSFDWPGLGLADRPTDFDYSIGSIGAWAAAAVDSLGVDRFHLVVHDAGGPVGFELAMRTQQRIRSLTILNTMVELPRIPFPGEIMGRVLRGGVGRQMSSARVWQELLYRVGVWDRSALPMPEVLAWRDLALGSNEGASHLEIMRRVRDGHDARRWAEVVDSRRTPYPVRIVWGGHDPALTIRRYGWKVLAATHLPSLTVLPARHFLQEDQAPQVATLIAEIARTA